MKVRELAAIDGWVKRERRNEMIYWDVLYYGTRLAICGSRVLYVVTYAASSRYKGETKFHPEENEDFARKFHVVEHSIESPLKYGKFLCLFSLL